MKYPAIFAPMRYCRWLSLTLALIFCQTVDALDAAEPGRRLGKIDVIRIEELHHITDTLGERIWPGFDTHKTPVAINNSDREELLIGHPDPPKEFHPFQDFQLDGQPVMIRDGVTRYGPGADGGWAVPLGGKMTAYVSTLPEGRDTEGYLSLLLHECFHGFQKDWAPGAIEMNHNLPEDDPTYSALIGLESRILRAAVDEPDEKKTRELAAMVVAVRHERRKDMPKELVRYEGHLERNEGTATYVEARVFQLLAESHGIEPLRKGEDPQYHGFLNAGAEYQRMTAGILPPDKGPIVFHHSRYNLAMAECLVLDRVRPGWKMEVSDGGATQFTLLEKEFPLTENEARQLLAEAQERFAYDDILVRQKQLVAERLDLLRKYVDAPGRVYRIYHNRIDKAFRWKPIAPVYEVPESLEREIVEKRKRQGEQEPMGESRRLVWVGGIRHFDKEGLSFQSKETPVTFGQEFLEWIDPNPGPDQSDMHVESKSEKDGVYVDVKIQTSGFTVELQKARIEWSKDLVKIYPVVEPKPENSTQ